MFAVSFPGMIIVYQRSSLGAQYNLDIYDSSVILLFNPLRLKSTKIKLSLRLPFLFLL